MFLRKIVALLCLVSGFAAKTQTVSSLGLLPVPRTVELHGGSFRLTDNFTVMLRETVADTILVKAVNRLYQTLNRRSGLYFKQKYVNSKNSSDTASFQVTVGKAIEPSIGADESSSLTVTDNKVDLTAPTTLGALHGLETLLQLLAKNKNGEFYFPAVTVRDAPRFSWRGLMIDVSR